MSKIIFKPLTPQDAAAYQALRLTALTDDPQSFLAVLGQEQQLGLDFYERELAAVAAHPCFGYHGVWENEVLLGYALIETSFLPKQRHIAFLYNLYVVRSARRRGLAKQLCEYIFARLRQETAVELIFLAYNSSNLGARDFYYSLGFKRCGIKPQAIKWQDTYDDEVELVLRLR